MGEQGKLGRAAAALAVALLLTGACGAGAARAESGDRVADQVVVRFRTDATADARKAARGDSSASVLRALGGPELELLATGDGESVDTTVERLRREPAVRAASPNFVYRGAASTPNDPGFGQQWGLRSIGAPEAWDLSTGDRAAPVAVVDSGVDSGHPELAPNVDERRGRDFVDDDRDPADIHGHGTHVAGTIAAQGNNAAGVAGINWRQALFAVRVLDGDDTGTTATVAAGLDYAGNAGAAVVSAAFTGAGRDEVLDSVMRDHPATVFVFAAGNSGSDIDRAPIWPCASDEDNAICVAATTQNDALAGFSNFGARTVDLAAPGDTILSTWPGGGLEFQTGTSMAAAHVAGVAALVLAHRPYLPAPEVRDAVLYGGDRVAGLRVKTATGRRLNARGAMDRPETGGIRTRCADKPRRGRLACFVRPVKLINRVASVTARVKQRGRLLARRRAFPNRSGRFFLRLPRSVKGRVRISLKVELRPLWLDNGFKEPGPQARTRRWG